MTLASASATTPLSLTVGVLVLAAAACQGEPDGSVIDTICLEEGCSPEPIPPISGRAIVDCWVTQAGQPGADSRLDLLDCRYDPPVGYPASLIGATVSGLSARGDRFSVAIENQQVGHVVPMAYIDPRAYPIELEIDIRFDPSDRSIAALEGLEKVTTRIVAATANDIASDRPASANIPFDLWEVNLLGRSAAFSALSFGYSLDVGAGESYQVAFKTESLFFGRSERFYLPVAHDSFAVEARMAFSNRLTRTATFGGPGTYAVHEGQLRRATDSDFPQVADDGSALAQCWFDGADGVESLYCQARKDRGIELAGAMIEVRDADEQSTRRPVTASPTLIATFSRDALPKSIAIVAPVSTGIIGLQALAGRSLRASTELTGKLVPRDQSRATIFAPFSVWEVAIDNRSEGFQGALDGYVLELGETIHDRFASFVGEAETPFVAESTVLRFLVASPAGVLELPGNGFVLIGGQAEELDFVLRPGTLIVGE